MNQKYEISEIAHPQYPWLHRIRALSDVRPGVPKGHLGGYVPVSYTHLDVYKRQRWHSSTT